MLVSNPIDNAILTVDDLAMMVAVIREDASRITEHIHKLDLNDTSNMEIVIAERSRLCSRDPWRPRRGPCPSAGASA